jgi:GT2 family glycosyltransferase
MDKPTHKINTANTDVVIVSYGNVADVIELVEQIRHEPNVRKVFVQENDNKSHAKWLTKSQEFLIATHLNDILGVKTEHQVMVYLSEANMGFGPANRQLITLSEADYVLSVNPDVEWFSGQLAELHNGLDELNCQAVAGMVREPSGGVDASFGQVSLLTGKPGVSRDVLTSPLKCGRVGRKVITYPGSNLLAHAESLQLAGGFSDYFLYYDEADLVVRLEKHDMTSYVLPVFVGTHGRAQSTGDKVGQRSAVTTYYATKFSLKFAKDHTPATYPVFFVARIAYCLVLLAKRQTKASRTAAKALIGR